MVNNAATDNDKTYVIFVTDGEPNARGTGEPGNDYTGYSATGQSAAINAARPRAVTLYQNQKAVLYGVFCGNSDGYTTLDNMLTTAATQANVSNRPATINGTDKEKIQSEFNKIAETIIKNLGSSSVSVDDGITELSSVSADIVGTAGGYEYFRSYKITENDGVYSYKDSEGTTHTVSTLNDPNVWSREETIKNTDGTTSTVTVYYYKTVWTIENGAPGASFSDDNGVTWDLSTVGVLNPDVVYSVKFDVWPSQEAFDLIANLNNRTIEITDLTTDEKAQIEVTVGGTTYEYKNGAWAPSNITDEALEALIKATAPENVAYNLKTNTHLKTSFSYNGNMYTDSFDQGHGLMELESTKMNVRKAFAHTINNESPFSKLNFYLTIDGEYYLNNGSTTETEPTKENIATGNYYTMSLPKNEALTGNDFWADSNWSDSIYISPGVMVDGLILETGHKYSLDEIIIVGDEFEYEFTPQTVRPMEIEGTLSYLVLEDKHNKAPNGAARYVIDDAHRTYRTADDNDKENVYYVLDIEEGSTGELVGTNRKTGELDITKWIVDNTGKMTDAQKDAETFTYRVTLSVPEDGDPTGMMGYEYVPRTDMDVPGTPTQPRYKIYGYQGEDNGTATPYEPDNTRFKYVSKEQGTYGAWNTQVYKYFVQTEVVDGKTLVVYDEDGNFTWLNGDGITAAKYENGFYTITLDVTINRNEIYRFNNLPSGTTYEIQEYYWNKYKADNRSEALAPSNDASNIDASGYSVSVKSTANDDPDDPIESNTINGVIDKLDTRYYNQFTNTLDEAIDAELLVKKALEGYDWTSQDRYYFNLAAGTATYTDSEGGTGTSPLPVIGQNGRVNCYIESSSSYNGEQYTYTFGKIRFTRPGTYKYTVTENAETSRTGVTEGIEFDTKRTDKTVTVTVGYDNNYKLTVTNIEGEETEFIEATATSYAIGKTTVTNSVEKTTAEATKAWLNADGSNTAPTGGNVEFTLFRKIGDGEMESTGYAVTLNGTPDSEEGGQDWVIPNAGGYEISAWKAMYVGLPKYQIGTTQTTNQDTGETTIVRTSTEISYYIEETKGFADYKLVVPNDASLPYRVPSGGTLTNKKITTLVKIIKVGDSTIPLNGVKFGVFSDKAGNNPVTKDATNQDIGENGVITTAAPDASAMIGTMAAGTTYYLIEANTVDGYNTLTSPVEISFTATIDGTTVATNVTASCDEDGVVFNTPDWIYQENDGTWVVKINNSSGVQLPHTGGSGTLPYTLSGFALMMASALMYGFRMRRRERRLN